MKTYLLIFGVTGIGVFCSVAQSQTTSVKLEIRVTKKTFGDEAPKPFIGVGVFDLLRGRSTLEGASCPDKSGVSGGVNCSIPCQATDNTPITIRVKPPSDQDHLAGWVTPAVRDVELRGCKLTPQLVVMEYEDAKYALNNQLAKTYAAVSSPGNNSSYHWIAVLESNPTVAAQITAGATASARGRSDLLNIYRLASEGSRAYKSGAVKSTKQEAAESRTLTRWQILSKSALLRAQVEKTIPENQRRAIKLETTDDLTSYVSSLQKADAILGDIKEKTPNQLKLSDDIKALRSIPATGKGSQAALPIIQEWK